MNTFRTHFKRNKKAFTIIELIVVIAVIGILVLLAAPKFLNYTKKAQLVRIQNDIKAATNILDIELFLSGNLNKWGEPVDIDLETLKNEKKVYTIEGLLTEDKNIESGPYWKIDKSDFGSKLPGEFYANSGGMVYYVDTKSGSVESNGGNQDAGNGGGGTTPTPEPTEAPTPEPTEAPTPESTITPGETNNTESTVKGPNGEEVPPGYTLLTDADFEFIIWEYSPTPNSYSVSSVNGGASTKGYFHYKGKADKVVIPHVIMGNDIKDYYKMFSYNGGSEKVGAVAGNNGTAVIAVASNNPNVTNMEYMFSHSQATSLDLSNFDTSNVTTMYGMFWASRATSLDLSNLDTSKVTRMDYMFSSSKATSIVGLDKFNTANVTTMPAMFQGSQATSLDLSSFDTSKVTYMIHMFSGSEATSLDLSNFDTSNVTNMLSMFSGSQAKSITFGAKFNTANVTDMGDMFYYSQATSLDLSSFDTSKVTIMEEMFSGSQATSLDLSSFDTSNVTNMKWMFKKSKVTAGFARTQADAKKFNATTDKPEGLRFIVKSEPTEAPTPEPTEAPTPEPTEAPTPEPTETPTPEPTETPTSTIAPGETNNTESTVKGPNGEEVPPGYTLLTDADFEFVEYGKAANSYSINGGSATKGYFHYKGKAEKVVIPNKIMGNDIKDYDRMFYYNGASSEKVGAVAGDNGIAVIAVAYNNPNVTSMNYMFAGSQATELDLSSFDTSNVTDMSRMFYKSQATELDLSSFDTSNVTSMRQMFTLSKATSIVGLDKFNTANVTSMREMFANSQATELDLSSFDTFNVTDMTWMFAGSQATELDLSSFDTSNVTSMTSTFKESQATKGFARTQKDANKFNATSHKPAGLKFIIKP